MVYEVFIALVKLFFYVFASWFVFVGVFSVYRAIRTWFKPVTGVLMLCECGHHVAEHDNLGCSHLRVFMKADIATGCERCICEDTHGRTYASMSAQTPVPHITAVAE